MHGTPSYIVSNLTVLHRAKQHLSAERKEGMKEFTNKPEVVVDTLFFGSQCCGERTMVIKKLPLNVWIREEFHSIWGVFCSFSFGF